MTSSCSRPTNPIADLDYLPQDCLFYLPPDASDHSLMTPEEHRSIDQEFNRTFFSPWQMEKVPSIEYVKSPFHHSLENPGYGKNGKKHTKGSISNLLENADLGTFPNFRQKAVTTRSTAVRELPTLEPRFDRLEEVGKGYQLFDSLQHSAIPPNTPLGVFHRSKDRHWVWAISHHGGGWISSRHIGVINSILENDWLKAPLAAVIKEDTPIRDGSGLLSSKVSIGTLFPQIGQDPEAHHILLAQGELCQDVTIKPGFLPKTHAVLKPMAASPRNVALLANELLSQPYGWGGIGGNRDCSAMLKDLFTPLGIWLPRNSADQARQGTFIPLGDLSPEDRESRIISQGSPYFTLIWAKGHIALYIGTFGGKAIIFHNTWGIPTRDASGREGRKIIGKAIISTLHLGKELPHIDPEKGVFLNRLEGMTLLVPWMKKSMGVKGIP